MALGGGGGRREERGERGGRVREKNRYEVAGWGKIGSEGKMEVEKERLGKEKSLLHVHVYTCTAKP